MKIALAAALAMMPLATSNGRPDQVRDTAIVPTIGTARLSGIVVTADTPAQPARRAVVTLTGLELRPSRSAITDDEGRFEFVRLPAGRVTLTASRGAFVTSAYGAKRPGRPGTSIAIAEGEQVQNLVVRLWRGAVIAGTLRDESGYPVAGVPITALPIRPPGGLLTLSNNGVTTDGLGEFRIFGLEPGGYLVMARLGGSSGAALTAMTDTETDAALEVLRRGRSGAASTGSSTATTQLRQRPFNYAPIYFPGTASSSQAATVTVVAGQEITGIDFAIQRVPTAVVAGQLSRPDGQRVGGARVQLISTASRGAIAAEPRQIFDATASPDGTFQFGSVPPGEYRAIARAPAQPDAAASSGSLWATADISVSGEDIRSLALSLEPGILLSGQVRIDNRSGTPAPNLSQLRIGVWLPQIFALKPTTPIDFMNGIVQASIQADGTFRLPDIAPDTYRLQLSGASLNGKPWWVRSATLGDRDLLDTDIDITRGANLSGVVVTLTDRQTTLSGALQTADGTPASDVFVIAFSSDRRLWGAGARRVKAVRPGIDGRYSLGFIPPGDYLVAALTDVDVDEWQDPAFLDRLVPAAIKVTIAEGEEKVQNIRLGSR